MEKKMETTTYAIELFKGLEGVGCQLRPDCVRR